MFVVHQPYFAPWLGYFAKFIYAKNFFALNDVLFSKRHNIDKAVIVGMNSEMLALNIPCGENMDKKISEIIINDNAFINRILKSIQFSYKKSKLFNEEWPFVEKLFLECMSEGNTLDLIDLKIIKDINSYLDIKVNIELSNNNSQVDTRTDRICLASKVLSDKELLLGDGKSLEVHDLKLIKENKISIYRLNYFTEHPKYFQCRRQKASFLPCMSIIDAILNVGREGTIKLLKEVKPVKVDY